MKILIIGNDLNSLLIAKFIKLQNSAHDIYLTTENKEKNDEYTPINIKENDIDSLVNFVKYNAIDFTIAMSKIAIINGIANEFRNEEFPIFAPMMKSSGITFFNSIAKKVMYKLKIPTPKFGIFDKEHLAIEYLRNIHFPVVISNDFILPKRLSQKCKSFSQAKNTIQDFFNGGFDKIIIEKFTDEKEIYVYFATDGYNALPLTTVERTKDKNYSTTISPSSKIDNEMYGYLLNKIIYPILDDTAKISEKYTGIIGLKLNISNKGLWVSEFYNGFQEYDLQAFLSILSDDLTEIFYDCALGCLSDNRNYINLSEQFSYSLTINNDKINEKNSKQDFDLIFSENNNKKIYTSVAPTLNRAKENLFENLNMLVQNDFLVEIKNKELLKELRI